MANMPKCLFSRCFFCINLRVGCAIVGSVLLLIKMTECFLSSIAAIDLLSLMKNKSKQNMVSEGEKFNTFAVAGFHWITMMIVCVLLEGLRKRDPLRVFAFNVCTMVAYAVYIPIFIYVVATNGGGYIQHDWIVTGLRIGIIGWYMYVMLIARSYHHELVHMKSNNQNNARGI